MRFQRVERSWSFQHVLSLNWRGMKGRRGRRRPVWSSTLPDTANADGYIPVVHAHVSGVSVIGGGHGLRRFLQDLSADGDGQVAIPTTLNSAGCDREKMEEMDIAWPDFLEQQFEIVHAYKQLGIDATLSCTPYDRGIESESGIASWAESNAVCFSNTWTSLITNRESGPSALATALTGYASPLGVAP